MIGLVCVLLIVFYFEASIAILRAYESPEQPINLKEIPTTEQEETDEKIKTEGLTSFNRLLNETQVNQEIIK